jgi:hypothetical protein
MQNYLPLTYIAKKAIRQLVMIVMNEDVQTTLFLRF